MKTQDEISLDHNLKIIAKSSFFVFIFLALSKVFTYLYRIVIARTFGPEVYGLFSLAVMIFGWFVLFSSFGISEGLIRYISLYRGKKDYPRIRFLLRRVTFVYLISGLISAVSLFFLSDVIATNLFHNYDLIFYLKIFSFLIPVYLFSNILLSILQAFEKIQWYSFLINVVQNVVRFFALFILMIVGFNSDSIALSYFLGYLFMLFISFFVCKYKTKEIFGLNSLSKLEKKNTFKSFLSYSWPLLFIIGISEIFYWTDTFFIGIFKGATEVGYYNAVVPIALLLATIPELFLKLFFPIITKEYSRENVNLVQQLSKQVGKWIFIITLPLFLVLFLFPGLIINILFGEEYLFGVGALRILSIGVLISNITWVNQNLLSMAGKSKTILSNILITSLVNVVLNILLIPNYGIAGAAFATTISKIILGVCYLVEIKLILGFIPIRRKVINIFILSAVPTGITFWLRDIIPKTTLSLALIGFLFLLVYLFLIFLTKSLDKNDLMILKSIKDKFIHNPLKQ